MFLQQKFSPFCQGKKKYAFWSLFFLCQGSLYCPQGDKKTPSVGMFQYHGQTLSSLTTNSAPSSTSSQIPSSSGSSNTSSSSSALSPHPSPSSPSSSASTPSTSSQSPSGNLVVNVQAKKFHIVPMAFGGQNDEVNAMVAADLTKAGLISLLPPFMGNAQGFLDHPDVETASFYGATSLLTFIVPQGPSTFRLYVYSCGLQQKILDEIITANTEREGAHEIANCLYSYLTGGHEGYFSKKILHLLIKGKGAQKKNSLAVIHQDGQEGRLLAVPVPWKTIRTLKAGPKGLIGYVMDNGRGKTQLRLRYLENGEDIGISMPGNVYSVAFSPCGNFLVACVAKGLGSDLWLYNLHTKEYRRLTFGSGSIINASPTINAQGHIIFSSSLQGKPKLFSIQANGSGLRCLSKRSGSYFSPTLSPKGDKVAFVYQQGGSFYLGIMNALDGTEEKLFLQGHMMDSPSWLNDITLVCSYQGARYGSYSFLVADIYGLSKYTLSIKGKPSVDMPSVLA